MAVLNWLLEVICRLIPKKIWVTRLSVAYWLNEHTVLLSQEVSVNVQPQSFGDCMVR